MVPAMTPTLPQLIHHAEKSLATVPTCIHTSARPGYWSAILERALAWALEGRSLEQITEASDAQMAAYRARIADRVEQSRPMAASDRAANTARLLAMLSKR